MNSDNSVKRLKGENKPYNTELIRKEMLDSLKCVDKVIIFEEDTPIELIKKLVPDIIVKGGDYKISEVVGNDITKVVIFNTVEGYSTTNLIKNV